MESKIILDKKICSGEDFFDIINESILSRDNKIISFVNPFSYFSLVDRTKIVTDIDFFFSDGSLHSFLHSFFYQKISRASFDYSSIADDFFKLAVDQSLKVSIIGATQDEIDKASKIILSKYPGLNLCYIRNGYFTEKEISYIPKEINKFSPDIIIVGMGTPYQEEFSIKLKNELKKKALIITCGGFLTQTSIRDDYYYPLVKILGIRWLQRMIMHKHVRDRVFKIYPKFLFSYIKDSLKNVKTS